MIKQIKQIKQKIYEIYEIQTQLRQLTKSELEKICFRMNCPKGTKKEMITSLLKPLQSITIYHASRHRSGGYGSEYIYPKTGKISITNHGMGSGIYGLSKQKMFSEDSKIPIENSKIYMYTVNNPIILDSETCTIYQEASKGLNEELEKIRKNNIQNNIQNKKEIEKIVRKFVKAFNMIAKLDEKKVSKSVVKFMDDYYQRKHYVQMPINYILQNHGYDGVVAVPDTICDSWAKGSVKFLEYGQEHKIISQLYSRGQFINGDNKHWVAFEDDDDDVIPEKKINIPDEISTMAKKSFEEHGEKALNIIPDKLHGFGKVYGRPISVSRNQYRHIIRNLIKQ